ncbi:MAG: chitobiase/beta-hexosaminidase C-terminal domain-containing protein, partial [Spirochaetaceae bacterium]|nr:chitobiase/beta-hexosaminidase C-terminal domain-containing protein [Spirochaetaceae bacterium]
MKKPFEVLFLLIAAFLLINCGGGGGGGGGAAAPSTTSTNETTTTTTTTTPTPTPTPTPVATLAAPTIQVPAGKALLSGSKVGITSSVAGATIYYTLDGTEPTSSSSVYNASKVTINSACTLKAIAIKDGEFSTVASASYSIAARKNTPDAVNDIVFKNGTAVAYSTDLYFTDEVKADAVAMIFYKGTECSNDGSTRTLGVGLKIDFMVPDWCKSRTVAAHDNNIDTIQDNVKNGSQNLEKIGAWLTAHSLTDDTGIEDNYHPFHLAKSYGARNGTYTDGWYLPSKAELQKVYDQKIT